MSEKILKKIGIITKRNISEHIDILKKLARFLKKEKKEIFFDANSCEFFKGEKGFNKEEILNKSDMAIVLGGDGTLLKTARQTSRKKTLVLGVNFGTLGFLTESKPKDIFECLKEIFKGNYHLDRRTLLRTTVYRNNKKIATFLALNDAVINQGAFARLIEMDLEINNQNFTSVSRWLNYRYSKRFNSSFTFSGRSNCSSKSRRINSYSDLSKLTFHAPNSPSGQKKFNNNNQNSQARRRNKYRFNFPICQIFNKPYRSLNI